MAKAGFVLHGARGKVGNLVARKGENKTILAEYQPIVKNPQTNAQMAQRIILSTVAQAIPMLYPIIDHSFEGFAVGSKCTREFRRLNMALLRQYAAIDFRDAPSAVDAKCFMTTKGVKALIPNRYQISSGSLAPSRVKISRLNNAGLTCSFGSMNAPATKSDDNYTFKLGDVLSQVFGLTSPGEQLTLVIIQKSGEGFKYVFNNDDEVPGWVIPYTSMRAARLVVGMDIDFNQPITVNLGSTPNYDDFIDKTIAAFAASDKTDATLLNWLSSFLNAELFEMTANTNNVVYLDWQGESKDINDWSYNAVTGFGHAYAAAIIRSKLLDNGNWAYSNSYFELSSFDGSAAYNYGLDWNSAIQAWFTYNAVTDNSLFLKEGATSNELGESFT